MNVILQAIVGSTAYGLATPESDIDQLGIFCASRDEILGLGAEKILKKSVVQTDPDITVHELHKFCSLALNGNPTLLELLSMPYYTTISDEGLMLVQSRHSFYGAKRIRASYGGYVHGQAERLRKRSEEGRKGFDPKLGKRTAKHARHCLRLLIQGRTLLQTGEIPIDMTDYRDYLFSVGEIAETSPNQFQVLVERELKHLDEVKTTLPEVADADLINKLLINIRKSSFE